MFFDDRLMTMLKAVHTIAVIGAKDKPGQPVDMVGRFLIKAGYAVIPVHPVRSNVWGLKTYTSVLEIPFPVDMIDVFRASEHCAAHAQEVLRLDVLPSIFWMQSGIRSAEAGKALDARGVAVVEDKCLMVELKRFGIGK